MSVSYDIRNLKTKADAENKRADFFRLLKLQQKLNTDYENAMMERSSNEQLGITPVKPKEKSLDQEKQDETAQMQIADRNLRTIMKVDEAQKVLSALNPNEIFNLNSVFKALETKLAGETNISSSYFLQVFRRYIQSRDNPDLTNRELSQEIQRIASGQMGTNPATGLPYTIAEAIQQLSDEYLVSSESINATLRELSGRERPETARARRGERLMGQREEQLMEQEEQGRTLLEKAREEQKRAIMERGEQRAKELETIGRTKKQKKEILGQIEEAVGEREVKLRRQEEEQLLEVRQNKIREQTALTRALRRKENELDDLDRKIASREEAIRQKELIIAKNPESKQAFKARQLIQQFEDRIQNFEEKKQQVRQQIGNINDTILSVEEAIVNIEQDLDQLYAEPERRLFLGRGMEGIQRYGSGLIKKPRYGRRIVGKGIEKQPETYKKFGRYLIYLPALKKGIFHLKFPCFTNCISIPKREISEDLKDFIEDMLDNGMINKRLYEKLNPDDRRYFNSVAEKARIDVQVGISENVMKQNREDMKRFELVKGIVMAGQNSPEVLQELGEWLMKFSHEGKLNKNQVQEILMDLIAVK